MDIHLHDHVEQLYQRVRNKALIQYFSPFTSVDLNAMAAAFNTSVAGLEKELARLIMEGSISARIDSHNKVTYPPHSSLTCLQLNFGRDCMLDTQTNAVQLSRPPFVSVTNTSATPTHFFYA